MEAKFATAESAHSLIFRRFSTLPVKEHKLTDTLVPDFTSGTRLLDSAKLISVIGKKAQNKL